MAKIIVAKVWLDDNSPYLYVRNVGELMDSIKDCVIGLSKESDTFEICEGMGFHVDFEEMEQSEFEALEPFEGF